MQATQESFDKRNYGDYVQWNISLIRYELYEDIDKM